MDPRHGGKIHPDLSSSVQFHVEFRRLNTGPLMHVTQTSRKDHGA